MTIQQAEQCKKLIKRIHSSTNRKHYEKLCLYSYENIESSLLKNRIVELNELASTIPDGIPDGRINLLIEFITQKLKEQNWE